MFDKALMFNFSNLNFFLLSFLDQHLPGEKGVNEMVMVNEMVSEMVMVCNVVIHDPLSFLPTFSVMGPSLLSSSQCRMIQSPYK